MKKSIIEILFILLISSKSLAVTCPDKLVCGKNECYAGEVFNDVYTLVRDGGFQFYPKYIIEGTYNLMGCESQRDKDKNYAPSVTNCTYVSIDYPSIRLNLVSQVNYYADLNKGKWVDMPQNNIIKCFNNSSECEIIKK